MRTLDEANAEIERLQEERAALSNRVIKMRRALEWADGYITATATKDFQKNNNCHCPMCESLREYPVKAQKELENLLSAKDMLRVLFNAYENGIACYRSPEDCEDFIGYAVHIDGDTFRRIVEILSD